MTEDFLPFALPDIGEAEIEAVTTTLRSGWLTTGGVTKAFESEFAALLGPDVHCVAVNSATAGLHLALEAIGVGNGDEVLVPTWTFTATAEVVRYLGADVVLVDVDRDTLAIDLVDAERKVTSRTKALMPVHFAGLPIDHEELSAFAQRHGIKVVEDAAHAFPAASRGVLVGNSASEAVVFSFYATKTMTTGEGGMVAVKDPALADRMRVMRLHGISTDVFGRYMSKRPAWQYDVIAPGFKYNLTDIASSIGRVQLSRASDMRGARESIAHRYMQGLRDLPVDLPPTAARSDDLHAWHLFVMRVRGVEGISRDSFISEMAKRGIGTSVHFIPLHKLTVWRDQYGYRDEHFPVASEVFEQVVSLPASSSLTSGDVDRVIDATREILSG